MRRIIFLCLILLFFCVGCPTWRTIGPYAKDIYYDENGNLVIVKEEAKYFSEQPVEKTTFTEVIKKP